jgi:hypothetical protein
MDNPVQVERSTGLSTSPQPELRSSSTVHGKDKHFQLNYYVVRLEVTALSRAAHHKTIQCLHGVIHVKALSGYSDSS